MAEFPALPLWTDAYLADCDHLTDAEHGRYLLLLMHMWRAPNRRFPNDDAWLARKFRRPVGQVVSDLRPLLAEFFKTDGNWLFHKRLEREWTRLSEMSRKQSERAKSRWIKEKPASRGNAKRGTATTTTTTTNTHETPNGVSNVDPEAAFREFYAAYPRKVGPQKAAEKYRTALKRTSHEEIMDGLRRAMAAWKRNSTAARYIPHPATWLHGGHWADEHFDVQANGHIKSDPFFTVVRDLQPNQDGDDATDEFGPVLEGARDSEPHETAGGGALLDPLGGRSAPVAGSLHGRAAALPSPSGSGWLRPVGSTEGDVASPGRTGRVH